MKYTFQINFISNKIYGISSFRFQDYSLGSSENGPLIDTVKDILQALPNEFDLKAVNEKHSTSNPVNLILQQEIRQYNRLIKCIRTTSVEVLDAIQGIQFIIIIFCFGINCR